jgi:DNA-binding IclR family transcriptional regulator
MEREDDPPILKGYKANAVQKAFLVLRAVAISDDGLRLVELADLVGFSRSTTHGLVRALLQERALIQDKESRRLFLGPFFANLTFIDWHNIVRLAPDVLRDIRDRVNATVIMGVRVRKSVMITAKAEAREPLRLSVHEGTNIPLFAGAAGKVFLSLESNETISELIALKELPRYTSNSIVDVKEYLAEIERVRSRGYAIDDEEYQAGIRAIAVALGNRCGPPAAIWIVGISSKMELERLEEVAEVAAVAAKKLRSQLDELRASRFGRDTRNRIKGLLNG